MSLRTASVVASIAAFALCADALRAGVPVAHGWRPPFAVLEQVPSSSSTHYANGQAMTVWNQQADLFRTSSYVGGWGPNGASEFAGFPSDQELFQTYGYHWNGYLALTVTTYFDGPKKKIVESDVVANPGYGWTWDPAKAGGNTFYYPPVLMHELGHAWGFQMFNETYDYDVPTVMGPGFANPCQDHYGVHVHDAVTMRNGYQGITALPSTRDVSVACHRATKGNLNPSTLNQTTFQPGQTLTVKNVMIENVGSQTLSNVRVRLHVTKGTKVTSNDAFIAEWTFSSFPAFTEGVYDFSAAIPAAMAGATWRVGFSVRPDGPNGADDNGHNDAATVLYPIAVVDAPGPPPCSDDAFEPNDSIQTPATVAETTGAGYTGLKICGSDSDWYRVWVEQGDRLQVDLSFSHAMGDLALWLFDDAGYIGGSTSQTDGESFVVQSAPVSGWYLIHVNGIQSPDTPYSMQITIDPPSGGSGSGSGPATFVPGDTLAGTIDAAGAVREAEFDGVAGMRLTVEANLLSNGLDVDVTLIDPDGAAVKTEDLEKKGEDETFQLKASGTFTLRIVGQGQKTGAFEIATERKLPKGVTKAKKKTLKGKTGKNVTTFKSIAGAWIDVPVVPKNGTPDTLVARLFRPDGTEFDLQTNYDTDGLSLVDVLVDRSGVWTLRYDGFPSPKNKLKTTVVPTSLPAPGGTLVTLP